MFKTEKTYNPEELFRQNMHLHTVNSLCSKPEMIFEDIVRAAERFGLTTIAVTDHSDPGSDIDIVENTKNLKERLAAIDTPVRVLVGGEMSVYGIGKFAQSRECDKLLDYCNYSHIHYHLDVWEQPEDRSERGYAEHMLRVLYSLFETDRADCVAHPFSPLKMKFFDNSQREKVLESITDNELGDILTAGEKAGCAWEIHTPTFFSFPGFSKRFWNIGKEAGVHFAVGTDAHNIASLDSTVYTERFKELIKNT